MSSCLLCMRLHFCFISLQREFNFQEFGKPYKLISSQPLSTQFCDKSKNSKLYCFELHIMHLLIRTLKTCFMPVRVSPSPYPSATLHLWCDISDSMLAYFVWPELLTQPYVARISMMTGYVSSSMCMSLYREADKHTFFLCRYKKESEIMG